MQVSLFQLCFYQELFWMNNKTNIEFGFRIMDSEISEGVIRGG